MGCASLVHVTASNGLVQQPEDQNSDDSPPYRKCPGSFETAAGKTDHGQYQNAQKQGVDDKFL